MRRVERERKGGGGMTERNNTSCDIIMHVKAIAKKKMSGQCLQRTSNALLLPQHIWFRGGDPPPPPPPSRPTLYYSILLVRLLFHTGNSATVSETSNPRETQSTRDPNTSENNTNNEATGKQPDNRK